MNGKILLFSVVLATTVSLVFSSFRLSKSSADVLNRQVKVELQASAFYQGLFHYFEASERAMPGTAKFFQKMSEEEKGHANKLMTYMNMRQAVPIIPTIEPNDICENITDFKEFCQKVLLNFDHEVKAIDVLLTSMRAALNLEEKVYDELTSIVKDSQNDEQLKHFIEHEFLDEQVESIKQMRDYKSQVSRLTDFTGQYLFDYRMLEEHKN
ncbi:hypothetical protein Ahia01_000685300 [Argonauta hians]